ncbi:RHS repeat domain-containing protein, partial [Bacteroides fragilis]|uniref:RHS repeat domain-containing protein n=1 Tax=Bacteroides fragilis TaxID=817 RepID=UPI00286F1F12
DRLLSVEDSRRGETRYSYTPTGQLERAEYPDGRVQWRKSDQTGNLYPDPDMKLRRYLGGGRLEQDGEWHCEYDADGNLTERYLGTGRWLDGKKDRWRYRWNADGSLAKVIRPDKREVEFTYDALGRRLSKSFGTTVTRWVWDGNVPLHQWKQHREYSVMEDRWNTDTERRDMTVWLFDEESFVPVAMIKEGRSYSILTDQLGTPTEAYDTEGNEVWSRVLDMDGNVIEETGNKGMVPFLFQGQYYDRETGLAYNRFRYYSPKMEMYVSQDPIGLDGGILNLYGYVSDTNVWIDALGLYHGEDVRPLNAYHSFHNYRLNESDYLLNDPAQFAKANESLYQRFQDNPEFANAMEKKFPGIKKHVSPTRTGKFRTTAPTGTTWHHATSSQKKGQKGWLQLVHKRDHQIFHKIYHPEDFGGRKEWGGGSTYRK